MRKVNGEKALAVLRTNEHAHWNRSGSSSLRSPHAQDASRRIFERVGQVRARYGGPRLSRQDPVFTMGSCFAREIEAWLKMAGATVSSIDASIERPEFTDADGRVRTGFFHRFTPWSMLQEFQQCFDELPAWSEDALVFPQRDGQAADLNYSTVKGGDYSLAAVRTRRQIARQLVRKAARARAIVLTLGLIEAWYHKPSALYANAPDAKVLARHAAEFQLRVLEVPDVLECLDGIRDLLLRHHETGDFSMVVTVSPVPLSTTFTAHDVLIANTESKAVLRAAASSFAARHEQVFYFPSYEMVTYANPEVAWREDRLHVHGKAVKRIVDAFTKAYYEPDAFADLAPSEPSEVAA